MMLLKEIDHFSEILKSNTPLLDVRAPIEYKEGSFPNAYNFPLMSDSETVSYTHLTLPTTPYV